MSGNHVLVSIPRGERAENALLRVEAEAQKLGGYCADIYFTSLNITGSWAYAKREGERMYVAQSTVHEKAEWVAIGKVELKVVHAHTAGGIRHLGRAGLAVGGLLGEDDHGDVSVPSAECVSRLNLAESGNVDYRDAASEARGDI